MKLVTLNDFLTEILEYTHESRNYQRGLLLLQEYQEFLDKKLNLNMFTPCDINGKPYKGKPLSPAKDSEWIRWENEEKDFFKAKEKVIFKGFEIQESDKWINFYGGVRVYNNCDSVQNMWGIVFENGKPRNKKLKTIADISHFKGLEILDKTSVLSF